MIAGTVMRNDMLWPERDEGCHAVVFDSIGDIDRAARHCRARNAVVQAGGNCGVWPKALAGRFAAVYTFEPDPLNFYCLAANVPERNVFKFNAALGHEHKMVELVRDERNIGAHRVGAQGPIPTLAIDALGLASCDLIYLDVEGYEFHALRGAHRTIRECKPVIAFEDKGISEHYGVAQGETAKFLEAAYGYRIVDRVANDIVMVAP